MDFRSTLFLIGLIIIVSTGLAMADETAINLTTNINGDTETSAGNPPAQKTGSDETLMNLALDARAYGLENGKMAATSAFSDLASFIRDGMYVTAYDPKGVLLADPYRREKIGSSFIADDHDAGLIRQLRDLAISGGGFFTQGDRTGISYYALDVDGSWWLVAVSGR